MTSAVAGLNVVSDPSLDGDRDRGGLDMLHHQSLDTNHRTVGHIVEVAILVLVTAMLLLAIPAMASVQGAMDVEPRPMAAPAPLAGGGV